MIKRLFDFIFASLGLLILSPFFLVIAILIKASSKGPVFYKGIHAGRNGRPFKEYKFRTMLVDAEKVGGSTTADKDPRITKVGRFLRKYKIDELSQLINVVRGEMSLVGPRPELFEHTNLYNEEEKKILSVLPGITDYASLKFFELNKWVGEGDADKIYVEKVRPEKNRLRLLYVKNQSFWEDLRILMLTLWIIIKKICNIKN